MTDPRGCVRAVLEALDRGDVLVWNGDVLLALDHRVTQADLWTAQAQMVLDGEDIAALRTLATREEPSERPEADAVLAMDGYLGYGAKRPLRCRLGFHTAARSQGPVGYCLRGCGDLVRSVEGPGCWIRYVEEPAEGSRPEGPPAASYRNPTVREPYPG